MIIAIDFDGTLCDHQFPEIGAENPHAFEYLRQFQEAGAKLILFTMRSGLRNNAKSDEGHEANRDFLTEAVDWCKERGITFWGVNQNPLQSSWTQSPKPYAHVYIDDAAYGCPMRESPRLGGRAMVDWEQVGPAVLNLVRGEASCR